MTRALILLLGSVLLSACSTVQLPDFGMNLPEFRENIEQLDAAYPQAEELPGRPTDVRSDAQWDASAREMQRLRESFDTPEVAPALSDAEFDAEYRRAQDYADEYKDDDPQ